MEMKELLAELVIRVPKMQKNIPECHCMPTIHIITEQDWGKQDL